MKNFIYGDFESKYDRTVFKKIPGKAPEAIFFTQSGKEVERLNIEKFDRYLWQLMLYQLNVILQRRVEQNDGRQGYSVEERRP